MRDGSSVTGVKRATHCLNHNCVGMKSLSWCSITFCHVSPMPLEKWLGTKFELRSFVACREYDTSSAWAVSSLLLMAVRRAPNFPSACLTFLTKVRLYF